MDLKAVLLTSAFAFSLEYINLGVGVISTSLMKSYMLEYALCIYKTFDKNSCFDYVSTPIKAVSCICTITVSRPTITKSSKTYSDNISTVRCRTH